MKKMGRMKKNIIQHFSEDMRRLRPKWLFYVWFSYKQFFLSFFFLFPAWLMNPTTHSHTQDIEWIYFEIVCEKCTFAVVFRNKIVIF